MDWKTFLSQNVAALFGFLGVLVGAVIGVVPSIWIQYRQRRWLLDDQRRNWKRERLLEHTNAIQNMINSTLHFAYAYGGYIASKEQGGWLMENMEKTYINQFNSNASQFATIFPHLSAVDDKSAKDLYTQFWDIYSSVGARLDKVSHVELNQWIADLNKKASELNRRIETLLESTYILNKETRN
jgi:hypothetical protein